MSAFYQIMIIPKKHVRKERVEQKLNLAVDWFRFSENYWVIYTTSNATAWQNRLKEFVVPGGQLFICKLDITDRNGWTSKVFWEWLRKNRIREAVYRAKDSQTPPIPPPPGSYS